MTAPTWHDRRGRKFAAHDSARVEVVATRRVAQAVEFYAAPCIAGERERTAELVTPAVLKALRAVLPAATALLPVGGITPDNMAAYRAADATGFGIGSALYKPGMTVAEVALQARRFAAAWRALPAA